MIREALGIRILPRDDTILVEGPELPVSQAERIIEQLRRMARQGPVVPADVRTVLEVVQHGGERGLPENIALGQPGRNVRPRTDGQALYVRLMRENDVVLCVGPAGTGKTFLAIFLRK
jgi:phosphate starvation-inducible PhoH-like protein